MYKLSNGLRVVVFRYPHLESTEMTLMFKCGSIYERPSTNGISHFVEHLLLKSTKKYDNKEKVRDAVKRIGAQRNGMTSRDKVWYPFKCLDEHITKGMDILSESVLNPLLSAKELEEERHVIITEIKKEKDDIDREVFNLMVGAVFKGTMSLPVPGDEETVGKLKHNEIVSYYKEFYTPQNTILGIYTSKGEAEICKKVEKYFSNWRFEGKEKVPNFETIKNKEKVVYWGKDTKSLHLAFGVETVKKGLDMENNALKIVRFILSDRLFRELRTKRSLIYSTRVWNVTQYGTNGIFYGKTEFDQSKFQEVLKETINVIKNLNRLDNKELEIAKNNVAASSIFNYENPIRLAFDSTYSLLYTGNPVNPKIEREDIYKVTKKDIVAVINKFLKVQDMSFVLAGDIDSRMKKILEDETS